MLLSGAMLGRRLGTFSQTIYLILGATGVPFFVAGSWGFAHIVGATGVPFFVAGSWGFAHIVGPTGGYLLGFVFAAYAIGKILSRRDSMFSIIIALVCGELIILLSGAAWLWVGLHFSLRGAFYLGVLPFIPGDAIKLTAAALICKNYFRRAKTLFY